ncbi:MAG: peptidoglycan DD-metalloendopeptidase family protein [Muribaculaceae bacterium]|nr:peptidoglycan DD-metalloendopeptidase family protein [Muribaculaceae bacterium]
MRKILPLFIILLLVAAIDVDGRRRTSSDVRREHRQNNERIARATRELESNTAEISRQLDRLQLLEAQIALRNDTINALQTRIDSVTSSINTLADSISTLETLNQRLKANYARTLRNLRTRRQGMSDVAFIFSASSFSQAWSRMRYLEEVARSTTARAERLKRTQQYLDKARKRMESLRDSMAVSMEGLRRARAAVDAERARAADMVATLRQQGRLLNRELERRRSQAAALERELQQLIDREAEEQRRREEEERRRREAEAAARRGTPSTSKTPAAPATPAAPTTYATQAAELKQLTGSFSANKGKLPFPVAGRYTIVSGFGTNTHPGLSKVKVDNLGIDIEVPAGARARSVFDGTVSSIFRLDGYNNVVIVRHGEYLTVYAGLGNLSVRKGDKVTTGQELGDVFTDGDRAKLHFEIRREKEKLNPVEWVK